MSLLANPVVQGLLGGGGPNAIRAQYQQQAAAMAPRGGGGMMGAPSPIVVRDNSAAELGQGLAGLGEGLAAIGQAREKAKQKEAFEAAIASLPPEQQTAARLNPDAFAKAQAEAMFRAPSQMTTSNTALFDVGGVPKRLPLSEGMKQGLPEWQAPKDLKLYGSDKTGYYTVDKGPDGKPIKNMIIAPAGAEPTSLQRDFQYAQANGYKGSFTDFIASTRATIEKPPSGYRTSPTGELEAIPGGPADPNAPKPMSETQSTAATFADRMTAANDTIGKFDKFGTSRWETNVADVPGIGNSLVSKEYQQLQQAQRSFLNAVLRRESGAVISPSEFAEGAKQYFPQPGDSQEVLADKARERRIAIEGMKRAAGPSYKAPERYAGDELGPSGSKDNPKRDVTPEESQKLPKGTYYIGTDGQLRVVE